VPRLDGSTFPGRASRKSFDVADRVIRLARKLDKKREVPAAVKAGISAAASGAALGLYPGIPSRFDFEDCGTFRRHWRWRWRDGWRRRHCNRRRNLGQTARG